MVRGFRMHQLGQAESRHLEALDRVAAQPELKANLQDLQGANDERLRLQTLLDEVAPWPSAVLQPQPDVTAERAQQVQERFEAAARRWDAYKSDNSAQQIIQARKGEPNCEGTAILDAYRRVDLEQQHIERHRRIEQMEQELAAVERQWAESHSQLARHLREESSLLRAVTECGEPGELWRQHHHLDEQRRQLEQRLHDLLAVTPEPAPQAATDMPKGAERLRQWRAAEQAAAEAAVAWSAVGGVHRAIG